MVVFFLPGGWATTCNPVSSISLPSNSSSARPPLNRVLKKCVKFSFTILYVALSFSLVSRSIFRIASLRVLLALCKSSTWTNIYVCRSCIVVNSDIAARLTGPSLSILLLIFKNLLSSSSSVNFSSNPANNSDS